jgi:hypothetical protein
MDMATVSNGRQPMPSPREPSFCRFRMLQMRLPQYRSLPDGAGTEASGIMGTFPKQSTTPQWLRLTDVPEHEKMCLGMSQ